MEHSLTAIDIAALRKADIIVYRHVAGEGSRITPHLQEFAPDIVTDSLYLTVLRGSNQLHFLVSAPVLKGASCRMIKLA